MREDFKVVHLVSTDSGGAYRAANRINMALKQNGVNSSIVVLEKKHMDSPVIDVLNNKIELVLFKILRKIDSFRIKRMKLTSYIYISSLGVDLFRVREIKDADVINIHWVNDGMLSYNGLKKLCNSGKIIVWTMHDMYAFTAGCYYDKSCGRYAQNCNNCPLVSKTRNGQRYISEMYSKKKAAFEGHISFIGCSRWMTLCAERSQLTKHHILKTIPNPIETDIFLPIEKGKARTFFPEIPNDDKRIVLFGAMSSTSDPRKGYQYLIEALNCISNKDAYRLIVFGGPQNYMIPVDIECISVGPIFDDKILAALYSLSDVFVAPSVQENLSNAVMEALACGTPTVAFAIGGMADMIEQKVTGYLAIPFDSKDLAYGIQLCSSNKKILSPSCREKVCKEFSSERIGRLYKEFYLQER